MNLFKMTCTDLMHKFNLDSIYMQPFLKQFLQLAIILSRSLAIASSVFHIIHIISASCASCFQGVDIQTIMVLQNWHQIVYSLIYCYYYIHRDLHYCAWLNYCLLFYNKDQEEFLLFNSMVYSLHQGYEAQRHVKTFEQISSAPIPLQATPLKFYGYIVNFFREICNTPCIIDQLIYIS